VDEAKAAVAEQQAEHAKVAGSKTKGPIFEAKRDLQKMVAKSDVVKNKTSKISNDIKKKCKSIIETRRVEVAALLRAEVLKKETTVDKLFLDLVKPGDETLSGESFSSYVQGLQGDAFKPEQVELLCQHIDANGIGRRRFQAFVQQYHVVVKPIAITNLLTISQAKTVRKAELEEVIEVLEGPAKDPKLGVERVRGKSLVDGAEGWISLRGNQGTPFLEEVEKPYYSTKSEVPLETEFKAEGEVSVVRALKADEVVELLEGPRKIEFEPGLRVRGKASLDDASGWFTVKDKHGTVFAEQDSKYFVVTAGVAMTDGLDIKTCKVQRKMAAGEVFTVEEGPVDDPTAGIVRVKGKAVKDEEIGWITLKGNAGTVFAEASTKHWCLLKEAPLTQKASSSSPGEQVRLLAVGEAFQQVEGPRKESYAPEVRIRVKALSDSAVGWVTMTNDKLKQWTSTYKCKVAVPVYETSDLEGAKELRQTVVNETFELAEGPSTTEGGALRMKAKATKDGLVGWVTIRDGDGKVCFEG